MRVEVFKENIQQLAALNANTSDFIVSSVVPCILFQLVACRLHLTVLPCFVFTAWRQRVHRSEGGGAQLNERRPQHERRRQVPNWLFGL